MTQSKNPLLITILGPTASGKTKLAVSIANLVKGEIISADSRQVYQSMDIGTGKDLAEYGAVPYHLIDILHPNEEYNLFNYSLDFCRSFNTITSRQHIPLLVGGTGMYLDAVLSRYKLTIAKNEENTLQALEKKTDSELVQLLYSLKPSLHNTTDTLERDRLIKAIGIAYAEQNDETQIDWPYFRSLIIGIRIPRKELKQRILKRLKARFEQGMIEEVKSLLDAGVSTDRLERFGLEYRYIVRFLMGNLNYNDMFQKLASEIFRFSKQQEKWFRHIEKKQHQITWLDANDSLESKATRLVVSFLE